jgi:hypothetical protein
MQEFRPGLLTEQSQTHIKQDKCCRQEERGLREGRRERRDGCREGIPDRMDFAPMREWR